MEGKFSKNYRKCKYDSKNRFLTYWHQIDEVRRIAPETLLEVGIGGGFVSNYLKMSGYSVTSVDVDGDLGPDVVADATDLPFDDESFGAVLCCQVLEHMPYQNALRAVEEFSRITRKHAVVSVPDIGRYSRFMFDVPKLGTIKCLWQLPRFRHPESPYVPDQHCWEISVKGYGLKKVMDDIRKCSFTVIRTFRVFEAPYYRFFILEKTK